MSRAGTHRRVSIADPLRGILLAAAERHASAAGAHVARVSVMSGNCASATRSYFVSPLRLPCVSPCIGLGLIGWGGEVGGAAAGLVAMVFILRPLGQGHDPGRHFHDEDGQADAKDEEQTAELSCVSVIRGRSVQRQIPMDERELDRHRTARWRVSRWTRRVDTTVSDDASSPVARVRRTRIKKPPSSALDGRSRAATAMPEEGLEPPTRG